jgi:hypothetical protein
VTIWCISKCVVNVPLHVRKISLIPKEMRISVHRVKVDGSVRGDCADRQNGEIGQSWYGNKAELSYKY